MNAGASMANKSCSVIIFWYLQRHFGAAVCAEIQNHILYEKILCEPLQGLLMVCCSAPELSSTHPQDHEKDADRLPFLKRCFSPGVLHNCVPKLYVYSI